MSFSGFYKQLLLNCRCVLKEYVEAVEGIEHEADGGKIISVLRETDRLNAPPTVLPQDIDQ